MGRHRRAARLSSRHWGALVGAFTVVALGATAGIAATGGLGVITSSDTPAEGGVYRTTVEDGKLKSLEFIPNTPAPTSTSSPASTSTPTSSPTATTSSPATTTTTTAPSTTPSAPASSSGTTTSAPAATGSASSPAPSTSTSSTAAVPVSPAARAGVPNLSGLQWNSGVYIPGSKASNQAAFASWRGAPLDVVVDWPARRSWSDITNPSWLYDAWKSTAAVKVFGVPPIPEDGSATIAQCAAGAYDSQWRTFGANIAKAGLADSTIIRLGWEFNGNWYAWQAKDPAAFAACWRRVVTAAESAAPGLRWDWTVNRGKGQSVADARLAYPGDAYVDIVGVDSYDGYPAATTEAGWQTQYAGEYGLKFWRDFAVAHGKAFSVPEWGVYPGTGWAGNNGGDNAFYINKMQAFFKESAGVLAYESYFNESASYYAGSLYAPAQNPKAAAAYKAGIAAGRRA